MLANFHTHTTFCDGESTAEEIVISAIEKDFDAIGFSGHGYTPFDLRYCMKETEEYRQTVTDLKGKYKNEIQIYLGIEEDAFSPVTRQDFDYIIGSSHYFCVDGKYYPIDSGYDYFKECLKAFDNDALALSEAYYKSFCDYIVKRKPDIVGHFDLITKYEEIDEMRFLNNEKYFEIAEKYLLQTIKGDVIFEVNTGAMARKLRTSPYPHERLLHLLKKHGGKIILGADSHHAQTLDYSFDETKKLLKDIGFEYTYILYDNTFKKDFLI